MPVIPQQFTDTHLAVGRGSDWERRRRITECEQVHSDLREGFQQALVKCELAEHNTEHSLGLIKSSQ